MRSVIMRFQKSIVTDREISPSLTPACAKCWNGFQQWYGYRWFFSFEDFYYSLHQAQGLSTTHLLQRLQWHLGNHAHHHFPCRTKCYQAWLASSTELSRQHHLLSAPRTSFSLVLPTLEGPPACSLGPKKL